ncbi:MAG: TetR/AcrR family transcriptional regulator C-terminal domain-containing protein [Actinomycetota bacterium]|jgi:AcrR family transcriptional regulator|nr:TetR/AcrR family transcriptional regulator C-terminal domain-containing protein [Actinomycetota bacterium]
MGRPKVAILSRPGIARAAIDILDEEGVDEFTLARVASVLGVKTSSLYNHIQSKEDLVDMIREIVTAPIEVPDFAVTPWDEALRQWARSYRDAFAMHPNTIGLLATRPIRTPVVLHTYEAIIAGLTRSGWDMHDCVPIITAIESFILGSALDMVAPEVMIDPEQLREQVPLLYQATRPTDSARAEIAFEMGIKAMISGFAVLKHNHSEAEPPREGN